MRNYGLHRFVNGGRGCLFEAEDAVVGLSILRCWGWKRLRLGIAVFRVVVEVVAFVNWCVLAWGLKDKSGVIW